MEVLREYAIKKQAIPVRKYSGPAFFVIFWHEHRIFHTRRQN